MPAFAGPLIGFALGALLARWGRTAAGVRGLYPTLAFGFLVFGPACAYPLIFFADWSYAYLVDSRTIPSALLLGLLLIDGAAPAAGFVASRRVLRREALGEDPKAHAAALALAIVPAGAALLLSVLLSPRLAVEGTLAMVRGGFGTSPLWRSSLGYMLVWLAGNTAAGAWLTARALGMARANAAIDRPPVPQEVRARFLGDGSGAKSRIDGSPTVRNPTQK